MVLVSDDDVGDRHVVELVEPDKAAVGELDRLDKVEIDVRDEEGGLDKDGVDVEDEDVDAVDVAPELSEDELLETPELPRKAKFVPGEFCPGFRYVLK